MDEDSQGGWKCGLKEAKGLEDAGVERGGVCEVTDHRREVSIEGEASHAWKQVEQWKRVQTTQGANTRGGRPRQEQWKPCQVAIDEEAGLVRNNGNHVKWQLMRRQTS